MQTIEEYFDNYIKCSYDVDEFDDHALTEMKRCFFAGAAAACSLSEDVKPSVIIRQLHEFIREINGGPRVN